MGAPSGMGGLLTAASGLWRRAAPDALRRPASRWRQAAKARAIGRGRDTRPGGPVATVEVAGLLSQIIGIGEGARLSAAALEDAGYAVIRTDLAALFGREPQLVVPPSAARVADVTIFHLNGPELLHLAATQGATAFAAPWTIGYWAWELEALPPFWDPAFHLLDEIWCPSEFTAQAVRARAPARVRVGVVPHPVHELTAAPPARARFDVPDEAVVVLTSFDVGSTFARKNPDDALEAFRLATQDGGPESLMICKVVGAGRDPAALDALRARAPANVRLLEAALSDAEMSSLIASADIVLSLHRAEGFGLLLARAMLAGKAVVATGWSGNLDFMTAKTSVLVPYDLRPTLDPQGLYRGGRWAWPQVEQAATALRALIGDAGQRAALGARAQAGAQTQFSADAYRRLLHGLLGSLTAPQP